MKNLVDFHGLLVDVFFNYQVLVYNNRMGKILDYKHVRLKCITNVFNMKLDKLKCELKWEDLFEESLNWFKIWTSLCKSDASLKSKQFHWKMLYRVFNTEQKLALFGLSSGLCKMCNVHEESLAHLLWGCPFAKQICCKSIPTIELYLLNELDIELVNPMQTALLGM